MTKKTHIAAIIPYQVFPAKMGGQKGIACFYEYLSDYTELTLITSSDNADPGFSNTNFLPVLGKSTFRYINPLQFYRIRKILKKNQCTHLVMEHPYFGWLGILLKIFCRIPLVVHSHNIESLRFKSTGKWWWGVLWNYEKFTHRMASLNFFVTDEDREYAIKHFSLNSATCHTITYGISIDKIPTHDEKVKAREKIAKLYHIQSNEKIILFNGTLNYPPNLKAVDDIIAHINPVLKQAKDFTYKIIVCGKGLPETHQLNTIRQEENIIYAGFVNDINTFFLAADIFINPVIDGGGIKTKLVESLAFNATVISSASGAIGIPVAVTGKKLIVCGDNDWDAFSKAIIKSPNHDVLPQEFFNRFFWGNITNKAHACLESIPGERKHD